MEKIIWDPKKKSYIINPEFQKVKLIVEDWYFLHIKNLDNYNEYLPTEYQFFLFIGTALGVIILPIIFFEISEIPEWGLGKIVTVSGYLILDIGMIVASILCYRINKRHEIQKTLFTEVLVLSVVDLLHLCNEPTKENAGHIAIKFYGDIPYTERRLLGQRNENPCEGEIVFVGEISKEDEKEFHTEKMDCLYVYNEILKQCNLNYESIKAEYNLEEISKEESELDLVEIAI